MSPLISFAAPAERCASARTSEATTAKPRPEVAGARRLDAGVERQQVGLEGDLVDDADDLADLRDDCSILLIASTARLTMVEPSFASSRAVETTSRARWAPSAVRRTVEVICCTAAADSSRPEACCSVRKARSPAAAAISRVPEVTVSVMPLTSAKAVGEGADRLVEVVLQAAIGDGQVRRDAVVEALLG